jgi:NAD(P)H-nitrite reductase large subunit
MQPDDDLCLCFHVTKRKVVNYLRIERPQTASQLSECGGAGTGCGWCRPILEKLFDAQRQREDLETLDLPDSTQHAAGRGEHIRTGKGKPPSAAGR